MMKNLSLTFALLVPGLAMAQGPTTTGNTWDVTNGNTSLVAPDNAGRPALEPRILKTISVAGVPPQGITEIVVALGALLNLRQIDGNTNAIVIPDTAGNIALAERLIADLGRSQAR